MRSACLLSALLAVAPFGLRAQTKERDRKRDRERERDRTRERGGPSLRRTCVSDSLRGPSAKFRMRQRTLAGPCAQVTRTNRNVCMFELQLAQARLLSVSHGEIVQSMLRAPGDHKDTERGTHGCETGTCSSAAGRSDRGATYPYVSETNGFRPAPRRLKSGVWPASGRGPDFSMGALRRARLALVVKYSYGMSGGIKSHGSGLPFGGACDGPRAHCPKYRDRRRRVR